MSDRPELTEYLGFFEAEPEILNPEVGWCYGAKFVSFVSTRRSHLDDRG